jgi:hypothetical protein
LAKSAQFEELAKSASLPELKKRYADIAQSYRIMASERRRRTAEGITPLESKDSGRP